MRPFAYERAQTSAEAVERGSGPSAAFLAGGTTLIDLAKLEVMQPERIVDITPLREVEGEYGTIRADRDGLSLGALVRMADAAEHPAILRDYPAIAQSLRLAASPQIRAMATLGGNVLQRTRCTYFRDRTWSACNKREAGSGCAALQGVNRRHAVLGTSARCIAAYAGDFGHALVALDARVDIDGARGRRTIPFEELHRLPGETPHLETTLEHGELLAGFTIPAAPWTRRSLFLKIRDRQAYDFALASAVVALDLHRGVVREARIALGGVSTKPWRAREAEGALRDRKLDAAAAQNAAEIAFADARTSGDNNFKAELGRRTLVRALLEAAAL
ncbi:MAG: xanthine dehydrogenase family protein subunit M [Candidatus Eremiobacteraeota bacterium]|nr:xanthine dehydrogenase family protein subunit M [Candidatus Eremiobacteraeota bacterium]